MSLPPPAANGTISRIGLFGIVRGGIALRTQPARRPTRPAPRRRTVPNRRRDNDFMNGPPRTAAPARRACKSTSAGKIRIASISPHLRWPYQMSTRPVPAAGGAFRPRPALGGRPHWRRPRVDFKGETITIQIGYGPGGGYDTYGRASPAISAASSPATRTWSRRTCRARARCARPTTSTISRPRTARDRHLLRLDRHGAADGQRAGEVRRRRNSAGSAA